MLTSLSDSLTSAEHQVHSHSTHNKAKPGYKSVITLEYIIAHHCITVENEEVTLKVLQFFNC